MQVKTKKFVAGLLLLTGIIGLAAFIFYRSVFSAFYPAIFPYMLAFFFFLNALFFFIFTRINKTGNVRFIRQFMMLTGLKLLLYLSATFIVVLLFRQQALNIALAAMILYLFFTGYEVIWLISLVKRKEENK